MLKVSGRPSAWRGGGGVISFHLGGLASFAQDLPFCVVFTYRLLNTPKDT